MLLGVILLVLGVILVGVTSMCPSCGLSILSGIAGVGCSISGAIELSGMVNLSYFWAIVIAIVLDIVGFAIGARIAEYYNLGCYTSDDDDDRHHDY